MTPRRLERAVWIVVAAALVALCLLGTRLSLATILFRVVAPPLGVVAALSLPASWLRRRITDGDWRYRAAVPAFVLALSTVAFVHRFPRARPGGATGSRRIELVTFNVLFRGGDPGASMRMLREQSADVLAFQEVTPAWLARLEKDLGGSHPYHVTRAVPGTHGLAVFSRYPLGSPVYLDNGNGRAVAQCVPVRGAGAAFLLCNVHLASPAGELERPGELVRGFESNGRMRAAQWHALRDLVARRFADLSTRAVVAGDLNTLEVDPLLDEIRRDFVDAFRQTRWQLGATFPNLVPFPPWPMARIDYVLTTPAIVAERAEVLPAAGSDHRGVRVVLRAP